MNKYLIILLTLIFASIKCSNESEASREICFETEVRPIITSNCTLSGCHNSIDKEAERDYSTYDGIYQDVKPGNHASSELYKVLIDPFKPMPPSPHEQLSEDKRIIIATWIEQGAKLNLQCIPEPCDTNSVTLSGSVRPILDLYCGSCHNSSDPQGNVDFRTYNDLKVFVDDGSLSGSINYINPFSKMPKNSSKMPDCEIAIIDKWIRLGAPNN